jgi:hypothetical protein
MLLKAKSHRIEKPSTSPQAPPAIITAVSAVGIVNA